MLLPSRRWRAAVIGVVLLLGSVSAPSVRGGTVVPREPEPSPAAEPSASPVAPELALASPLESAEDADVEPFWYPGADGLDGVSLSAVPIDSSPDPVQPTSPFPGSEQHPLIPLPGAAWTGMAGLLGLGAVKLLRNVRRLLA